MNFIRRNIPNMITCGNLLCGCLAIVKAFEGDLVWAAYLVGIAAVLDFFDGFAARMLKVSSPIGKDLDSLADMVTFGVIPGVVMFQMIKMSLGSIDFQLAVSGSVRRYYPNSTFPLAELSGLESFLPYIAFLIPVFSAIRLAKFNNDPRQSDSFIGLPTPANAIFICSLGLIACIELEGIQETVSLYLSDIYVGVKPDTVSGPWPSPYLSLLVNPVFLSVITVLFSILLVSELPLIALKFKHFKWKGNEIRFIFLIGAITLLATLQLVGIPLVIVFYILVSIINNILTKKKAGLSN